MNLNKIIGIIALIILFSFSVNALSIDKNTYIVPSQSNTTYVTGQEFNITDLTVNSTHIGLDYRQIQFESNLSNLANITNITNSSSYYQIYFTFNQTGTYTFNHNSTKNATLFVDNIEVNSTFNITSTSSIVRYNEPTNNLVYFYDDSTNTSLIGKDINIIYPDLSEISLITDSSGKVEFNSFYNGLLQLGNYTIQYSESGGRASIEFVYDIQAPPINITYNISKTNLTLIFFDEITLNPSYNVTFEVKSDIFSGKFNLSSQNNYTLIGLPYSDIYEIRYGIESGDYAPRSYFFRGPSSFNNASILRLYTINISQSSLFQRNVFDQGSIPLGSSIVEVQRPYSSDNNTGIVYKTVDMALIDDEGSAIFSAVPNTQAYRLRFLTNFTIIQTQSPTYFVDTTSEIIVRTEEEFLENFKQVQGVSGSVYYQNTSDSFIFDYIGSGVGADEYCLEVTKRYGAEVEITQQCSIDETATLIVAINSSEPGSYLANGYAIIGEIPYLIDSATNTPGRLNGKDVFGIWAVLILILGLIVAATMGAFVDPKISIIFSLLLIGSFGLYLLDLVAFSFIAMGGLIVLGVVVLYLYEKSLRG